MQQNIFAKTKLKQKRWVDNVKTLWFISEKEREQEFERLRVETKSEPDDNVLNNGQSCIWGGNDEEYNFEIFGITKPDENVEIILDNGEKVKVNYNLDWNGGKNHPHFKFYSHAISETGYKSHFPIVGEQGVSHEEALIYAKKCAEEWAKELSKKKPKKSKEISL